MKLEINGIEYTNFKNASAEIRLDALSNTFSFELVTTQNTPLPFRGGETCRVIVDDEPVVTGFIEVISGSHDGGSHVINVQGRDKTGDLLDSTTDAISDIKAPISLAGVIQRVLDDVGVNLGIIDEVNPALFNAKEDIGSIDAGDSAFETLEKLARKRQVFLTSNGDGDIVISKTPGGDSGGYLQNIIGADDNNILAASFSYDTTGRFNQYKTSSSLSPLALATAGTTANKSVVNQSGIITDAEIRAGRQLVLVAETSASDDQNKNRATWEAAIRKARGRVYSCTVQGYKPDPDGNFLWNVNELVRVVDEFADIQAQMLINSVAFGYDLNRGRTTTLSMVEANAYQLTLDEPKSQKITGNIFKKS